MKKQPTWVKSLPKKVIICGKSYSIIYIKDDTGASGNATTCRIKVGCGYNCSKHYVIDSLIHEISELIHLENYHSYSKGCKCNDIPNGDRIFVFNHDGFEQHTRQLIGALRNCGLLSKIAL